MEHSGSSAAPTWSAAERDGGSAERATIMADLTQLERYPEVLDAELVGTYPAPAKAGGGLVWDAVAVSPHGASAARRCTSHSLGRRNGHRALAALYAFEPDDSLAYARASQVDAQGQGASRVSRRSRHPGSHAMDSHATSAGASGRQQGRLYSPLQIAAAAFVGSPLAASWLFARNFSVLGDHQASRRAHVFGMLATMVVLAVAFVLPERFPAPVLPMAYTFGIRELAKQRFETVFQSHVAAGGERQSNWFVLGIALCGLALVIGFGMTSLYLVSLR